MGTGMPLGGPRRPCRKRGWMAKLAPTLPLLVSTLTLNTIKNDSPMRVIVKFWPMLRALTQVERGAERRHPLGAHAVAVRGGDHVAGDRAFERAEAHVERAARRPIEERADVKYLRSVGEEIEVAVGDDRRAVADVPAEIVIDQAQRLAEVVAIGVGKDRDVGVEHDPVDDVLIADRPALGLPALAHAEPGGEQVVGDFGRGRRDPTAQAAAQRRRTARRIASAPAAGRQNRRTDTSGGRPRCCCRRSGRTAAAWSGAACAWA